MRTKKPHNKHNNKTFSSQSSFPSPSQSSQSSSNNRFNQKAAASLESKLDQIKKLESNLTSLTTTTNNKTTSTSPNTSSQSQQTRQTQINDIRLELCQTYSDILLSNLPYSYQSDVPNKLWRNCFYNKINDLRMILVKDKSRYKKLIQKAKSNPLIIGSSTNADEESELTSLIKQQEKRCHTTQVALTSFLKEAIVLYEYYVDQLHGMLLEYYADKQSQLSQQDDEDEEDNKEDVEKEEENQYPKNGNVIMKEIMNELNQNDKHEHDRNKITFSTTGTTTTTPIKTSSQSSTTSSQYIIPILYRIYIHLGDLYRYSNNYTLAEKVYRNASYLAPGKGNPYNQLAVCAQINDISNSADSGGNSNTSGRNEKKDANSSSSTGGNGNPLPAVALYWYCRSLLASHEAFMTSKSNLERLFTSNKKWIEESTNSTTETKKNVISFADITKKNILDTTTTDSMNTNDEKEKKDKSSRSAKSIAKRKFLCNFVHFHGMLFSSLMKTSSSTSTSEDVSKLTKEMDNLVIEFKSIMETNGLFGDAFLLKLVCINAFSVWNGFECKKKIEKTNDKDEEEGRDDRVLDPTAIALIFTLKFATQLCSDLVSALEKGIVKQEQKKEGEKMFGSIRFIGPVFLLFAFISNECNLQSILRKLGDDASKGLVMEMMDKSVKDFWESVANVATIVAGNEALMTLIESEGDADIKELPDDFHSLIRGYRPFLSLGMGEGSKRVYLTPEEAIDALELDQSQTQTQTQQSQPSQRSSKKSSTQQNNNGQDNRTPEKIEIELKIKLKSLMKFIEKHLGSGELWKSIDDEIKASHDHSEEEVVYYTGDNTVDFSMDVDTQSKDNNKDVLVYTTAELGKPSLLVPGALLLGGGDDLEGDNVDDDNDAVMKESSNVSDVTLTGGIEERNKSLPNLLDPALLLDKENNDDKEPRIEESRELAVTNKKSVSSLPDLTLLPGSSKSTAQPQSLPQSNSTTVRPPPGFHSMQKSFDVPAVVPPVPPGLPIFQQPFSNKYPGIPNGFSSSLPLPQTSNPFATSIDGNNVTGFRFNDNAAFATSFLNSNSTSDQQSLLPLPSYDHPIAMGRNEHQYEEQMDFDYDIFGLRSLGILSDGQNNDAGLSNFSVDSLFQNPAWKQEETQNPFAFD